MYFLNRSKQQSMTKSIKSFLYFTMLSKPNTIQNSQMFLIQFFYFYLQLVFQLFRDVSVIKSDIFGLCDSKIEMIFINLSFRFNKGTKMDNEYKSFIEFFYQHGYFERFVKELEDLR